MTQEKVLLVCLHGADTGTHLELPLDGWSAS